MEIVAVQFPLGQGKRTQEKEETFSLAPDSRGCLTGSVNLWTWTTETEAVN